MEYVEGTGHQEARARIVDVELHADGGGDIADDRLGDAEQADGLVGKAVLDQADDAAGQHPGNGRAAGDGEKDGHDQRQVEDAQERQDDRQVGLHEDGDQRDADADQRIEALVLRLPARGVGDLHAVYYLPLLKTSSD